MLSGGQWGSQLARAGSQVENEGFQMISGALSWLVQALARCPEILTGSYGL